MQWNKIPENNLTNRKEEQLHFASIIPAPRMILLNIKRELPVQKEFSLRKEESGVSYQLSQTFGAPHKGPASVSLHSGKAKLRYRDGWEQGKRGWAASIRHTESMTVVSHDLLLQRTLAAFIAKNPNDHHSHHNPKDFIAEVFFS